MGRKSGVTRSSVDQGTYDLVTATIPAGTSGRCFVRLRVTGDGMWNHEGATVGWFYGRGGGPLMGADVTLLMKYQG